MWPPSHQWNQWSHCTNTAEVNNNIFSLENKHQLWRTEYLSKQSLQKRFFDTVRWGSSLVQGKSHFKLLLQHICVFRYFLNSIMQVYRNVIKNHTNCIYLLRFERFAQTKNATYRWKKHSYLAKVKWVTNLQNVSLLYMLCLNKGFHNK